MTPKAFQLLVALEPGVIYDAYEACRRAGIKARQGVSRRAADIPEDFLARWYETNDRGEDVLMVRRDLVGYSLPDMNERLTGVFDSSFMKHWAEFDLAKTHVEALARIGEQYVASAKMCSAAFIYKHAISVYPTLKWEKVSPTAITVLHTRGILLAVKEDELAIYYRVADPIILPALNPRRWA